MASVDFRGTCLTPSPSTVLRRDGDETYLLNTETGHFLVFSGDAADLVELCDGTRPVREIVAAFLDGRPSAQAGAESCYGMLKRFTLDGDLVLNGSNQ